MLKYFIPPSALFIQINIAQETKKIFLKEYQVKKIYMIGQCLHLAATRIYLPWVIAAIEISTD